MVPILSCIRLLDATRRYSTLLDATRCYSTLLDATRRYSTLLDATRRYSTVNIELNCPSIYYLVGNTIVGTLLNNCIWSGSCNFEAAHTSEVVLIQAS
jgi:hypothetical protein